MLTISQFAKAADVNIETVRYYERRGLIKQPDKPTVGYRRYPQATLNRVQFIKRAQELGFSLKEVANLLLLGESHCSEVEALTKSKLASVLAKINNLRRMESVLIDMVKQCDSNPGQAHCPIIESLQP